jgi:CO dehydrogenase nickel-insertion accessory protein CooC1
MTTTIALAGKGGVGKTTVAGMIIKYLAQNQPGSILAIDADPSSNLNMVLGLDLEWTVGEIREDMLEQVKTSLAQGGAAMGTLARRRQQTRLSRLPDPFVAGGRLAL